MPPGLRTAMSVLTAAVLLLGSGMIVPLNLCLCPAEGLAIESALDLCCPVEGSDCALPAASLAGTPDGCGDCTDIPVQPTWARGGPAPSGKDLTHECEIPAGAIALPDCLAGAERHLVRPNAVPPPSSVRSLCLRC